MKTGRREKCCNSARVFLSRILRSYRAYGGRLSVNFAAIEKFRALGRLRLQVSGGPGAQRGRSGDVARVRNVAGGQWSAEREIRPVEPRWPLEINKIISKTPPNFIEKFFLRQTSNLQHFLSYTLTVFRSSRVTKRKREDLR